MKNNGNDNLTKGLLVAVLGMLFAIGLVLVLAFMVMGGINA